MSPTIAPDKAKPAVRHALPLDISVLEWCKLLGEEKDKHFWRNVVTDPAAFEASLLAHLGMTASDFVDLAKKMRRYRDKFVAHLDSEDGHSIANGCAGREQFLSWAYR